MIRHIVLFRFRESTPAEDIAHLERTLAELPAMVPVIRAYRFGSNATSDEGNADFAVQADFDDVADYEQYRDDPGHRKIILEVIRPMIAERTAIQIDL